MKNCTKKTLLAAALAVLAVPVGMASPVMADVDVSKYVEISQIGGIDDRMEIWQQAINSIVGFAYGENPSSILNLGVNNAGNTQFGSNQVFAVGWGQTGGSVPNALVIDAETVAIEQTMGRTYLDDADNGEGYFTPADGNNYDVYQGAYNFTLLGADGLKLFGAAAINGLSQIGYNAANVAAVSLPSGANLSLSQDVQQIANPYYFGESDDHYNLGMLEQWVANSMVANLGSNYGYGLSGNGRATINGAYGEDLAQSSVQYGANAVNNALVSLGPETASAITLSQNFGRSTYFDNYDEVDEDDYYDIEKQGYLSGVENIAIADADNFRASTAHPFGEASVKNLDQIAQFSGNSFSLVTPGTATASLEGTQSFQNSLWAYDDGDVEGFDNAPFSLSNLVVASNGNYGDGDFFTRDSYGIDAFNYDEGGYGNALASNFYGGFGDAIIDKVTQTAIAGVNSVTISGPTTTAEDGTKTTADAGLTTIAYGNQFTQQIQGLNYESDFYTRLDDEAYPGLVSGIGNNNYDYDYSSYDGPNGGNLALAYTGIGNAGIYDLSQINSLTGNTFSTSGSLKGLGVYDVHGYDYTVTPIPDIAQSATGAYVNQENIAVAYTHQGVAGVSGSQVANFSLNSLTVGGELSGNYAQSVYDSYSDIDNDVTTYQTNTILASADKGSVVIGDRLVNGALVESPVSQTVVSSVNSMSIGKIVTQANLSQNVAMNHGWELDQGSFNTINAVAPSVALGNISQAVLNKVNTITASIKQ